MRKSKLYDLVCVLFFICVIFILLLNPIPQPLQTVFILVGSLGVVIWGYCKADEVERAVGQFCTEKALLLGSASILIFVLVMQHVSRVAEFVAIMAAYSTKGLPPAAVGFGLGVSITILLFVIFYLAVYGTWWLRTGEK